MRLSTYEKWTGILKDLEDSQLTAAEFARQRGIHPVSISVMKSKLKNEPVITSSKNTSDFSYDKPICFARVIIEGDDHVLL